ncbi:DUF4382 domain-containing protein [Marinobacter zhanjiangensis]|uniref:DUF4382 domain-containing protein n=1 Tax=Marinobacter zhanjiangensis TaxID=578215 RepID=A0ABQ3B7S6_9GAMM|nr:DUF4382 domain-containing protein [Marinobacter zhanjiangensis]GGY83352.1 hypothetical protein GCM10007071_33320 [Marinobacter zhanjiangensis]
MKYPLIKSFGVAALAAAVAACGGSGSGSDDSTDSESTGTMSLGLTDAPVTDLAVAQLNITSVEVKPAEADSVSIELETPVDINLLDFQGGKVAQLFEGQEFPAGQYEWIRLHLGEDPYVVEASDPNQTQEFLFLPSGPQTGLKLNGGFVIPAGGSADFTIDFDVKKSIFNAGGEGSGNNKYMLKPAHRLVDNVEAGAIVGEVDVVNLEQQLGCDVDDEYYGSVYVYEGADVTPTDLNVTAEDEGPLVAVSVTNEDNASLYSYKAAFLTEGDYTISYTCQPDDNETSETLEFVGTQNVTVTAGEEIPAVRIE